MYSIVSFFTKTVFRIIKLLIKSILLLIGREIIIRKKEEVKLKTLVRKEFHAHMNEFLNVVSHDLKTPLTSIKGNLQLMGRRLHYEIDEENALSTEMRHRLRETRELLDRTNAQVNRLARIVNSLLESSRIHANTMDLLFELCELNILVCEVIQDTRATPAERLIQLSLPEGKAILVMADANRIKQVILQYLSNAHKYSAIEEPIEVTLHDDGHVAYLQVRDRGQGIALSEQQRIWERYYRVPGSKVLSGSEVGLGLGLHISRTIVEQHNGKVGVLSAPGRGSTFWFTLPLAEKSLGLL